MSHKPDINARLSFSDPFALFTLLCSKSVNPSCLPLIIPVLVSDYRTIVTRMLPVFQSLPGVFATTDHFRRGSSVEFRVIGTVLVRGWGVLAHGR